MGGQRDVGLGLGLGIGLGRVGRGWGAMGWDGRLEKEGRSIVVLEVERTGKEERGLPRRSQQEGDSVIASTSTINYTASLKRKDERRRDETRGPNEILPVSNEERLLALAVALASPLQQTNLTRSDLISSHPIPSPPSQIHILIHSRWMDGKVTKARTTTTRGITW